MRFLSSSILLYLCLTPAFAQRVITTVAGTDWLFPGDGRPAIDAPLSGAGLGGLDIAVDRKSNYYICDGENLMVMRVGPDGLINVIAGNGVNFASGDNGPAVNAGLLFPLAIALDSAGNLYIAELGDDVRKVTPAGIITTIAGTGVKGFSGDNGPATQAQLYGPSGLAVDSAGNLYIADTYNSRIRKVTPDGTITTIAGTGQDGYSGDNGLATSAQLNAPRRIALDAAGNLYVAEALNERVRKVDTRGIITTVAGGGPVFKDGVQATSTRLLPTAIAFDAAGNMYIADILVKGIRKVDTQGRITTVAGRSLDAGFSGDGGPALNASFGFSLLPALAVDSAGNILFADAGNQRIRKISPDGIVNTIAGNGLFRFSGNGGPATSAALNAPLSVVSDRVGNIYITEAPLSRIRRITPDGVIDVFAGNGTSGYSGDNGPAASAALDMPQYLTFDAAGNLYVSDLGLVRKIDTNGIITTYAGTGNARASGDGLPATQAEFVFPQGIDFDGAGNLIIADNGDNRLRIVIPASALPDRCKGPDTCVITLAGNGQAGYSGDNGVSFNAQVNSPTGVRVYNGGIYFADSGNNRIRRIDIPTLIITTVAGNGEKGYSGDGGPATQAALDTPASINFDAAGNMYIADTRNSVVRQVTPDGIISTFIRPAKKFIQGDGGPVSSAGVGGPSDIFVDSTGNILIADFFLHRIRSVLTTLPSVQVNPANLAFTAPAGSTPASQRLDLVGSIPGVPFSASAATATNNNWLQVSPTSGVMPGSVVVTVDPSLSPGSYQGTVTITSPNAQPSTQSIPVSLTVTGAGQPSLDLKPTSLTFSFVQQSQASSRSLSVSNVGGGSLAFTAVTATTAGGSWLSAGSANGTVGAFASIPVTITADPSRLGPGTYSGTVTFASPALGQKIVVPVTMAVSAVQQTILIPQTGLAFFAVEGTPRGSVLPQFFSILNTGSGQMRWSVNPSTLSGGDWLGVFPSTGVTDAAVPLVPRIRVDIDPGGLSSGVYYGTIQVAAPEADNTPQAVSVVLTVLKPGGTIGPIVQPAGLLFVGVPGSEAPGSQTVLIQNTSGNPLTFTSGAVTVNGQPLFDVLPGNGTVSQTQPLRIIIQPKTSGLTRGVYRGALTLSFSDGSTHNIALVLVLVGPGSGPSSSTGKLGTIAAAQSACVPRILVPVFTSISEGFNLPTAYPGQVTAKVVDDCANPMTAGGVSVEFSNRDPTLRLTSLKNGDWAGTWTPRNRSTSVVVTATASIPEQNLKGQVIVKGGLQTASQPPVINEGGVVNGASFASQTLAPGSLITVFGSQLAQSPVSAGTTPLPTSLGNGSILISGRLAPLLFASDGQVNAVIPYGISVNTSHQVIASRSPSISAPQSVLIAAAAPGIFTKDGTQGAILDKNNAIADSGHPAGAGDALVIYCTGLGEVNPPVTAGSPAPSTPLSSTVVPVSVSIGGMDAKVLFSGLSPGFIGLYQVNAVVPSGVAAGDHVPVVLTAAGQASTPATIALR